MEAGMPQLHFYLPKDLAEKVRRVAEAADMPVSRYVAELVKREIALDWPEGYFEEVIGGWVGEPPERPPQGDFEIREPFETQDG
jgi:hypothetical protein